MKLEIKTIILFASIALSSNLKAGTQQIPNLGESDASVNIAQVQTSFTIKKPEGPEQTRINLVVMDHGGSTDVSPTMGLYLIFWKDGEMGDATASFHIEDTFSLVDYTELPHGKLELKLKQLGDHGFEVRKVTVDYSEFAAKFERDAATIEEEFGVEWVQGSIYSKIAQ